MNYLLPIPKQITIGGQRIDIDVVKGMDCMGTASLPAGKIDIAETFKASNGNIVEVSPSVMQNTLIHEILHCCLENMGYTELAYDEHFICGLASSLNEVVANARFPEEAIVKFAQQTA